MAAMAADWFTRGRQRPTRVGFFGVGLIARYIHKFLAGTGWSFDEIGVHDLSADSTAGFVGYLEASRAAGRVIADALTNAALGDPDGVARVLAFLASEDAEFVRGTIFTR